ncbi:MAG: GIDE domain-containing protein [Nitrospirota bacterium]
MRNIPKGKFLSVNKRNVWFYLPVSIVAFTCLYIFFSHTSTGIEDVMGYIHEIVFILIGLGLFFYGFFKLKKKRLIEDIPTSKIRSVAMGFGEVKGTARQKMPLQSRLTHTECVYYKFLIEEERRDSKGRSSWVTVDEGSSTEYFYIEDETGKILVDPLDAEVILPYDYRQIGLDDGGLLMNRRKRYTEWYITPGEEIYVLGNVQKFKDALAGRKEKLILKLQELKQNKEKLMQYDTNKDERIDITEWDIAVEKTKQELFEEEIKKTGDMEDDIVITKGEIEKTFIISDMSEKRLVRKMAIQGYLCISSGFCIIIIITTSLLARSGLFPGYLIIPWEIFYR